MTQWVEIDPAAHGGLRVLTTPAARFGDDVGVASVLPCEYPRLVAHYPIFFRKSAQTGQFEPAALLGFGNRENLFLSGERWDADYVPLQFQRQPFTVVPPAAGAGSPAGEVRIAIDLSSPRVVPHDGAPRGAQALFTDDGRPTSFLQRIAGVLKTFMQGAPAAFEYAQALAQLDLLEPVSIEAQLVDRSRMELQGLYTIRSEALESLPAEALVSLRDRGHLRWAYFQLASMSQLAPLIARKNRLLTGMT